MKPPSGRQLQTWFKNEALENIEAKAKESNRSVAWIIRQSVKFTLNNPSIEWVDGTPVIKKDSK